MFEGLDSFDKANALYLTILLVFVATASLSLRRVGFGRLARMALAWIGIFTVLLVIAAYRDEAKGVLDRVVAEADPARGRIEGSEFTLRARSDGHFWVRGKVNGEPVLFLIDTGASGIVLTNEAARRAGIDFGALSFDQIARTANGAVRGAGTRVAMLEVGPIARSDVPVSITEGDLEVSLLGMQFLRTLRGWRVEGDTLFLTP